MTILNIVLACLLAFLLIYLVVILRERSNLKNRIYLINETDPNNIPLNEWNLFNWFKKLIFYFFIIWNFI